MEVMPSWRFWRYCQLDEEIEELFEGKEEGEERRGALERIVWR
jgi:hypothetical protein